MPRQTIDGYVRERAHLKPRTIINHLALLSVMLHTAVELDWLEAVPRIRKPSPVSLTKISTT